MVRTSTVLALLALLVLAACAEEAGEAERSTPIDTPTTTFEIISPEVDTGWPGGPLDSDTDVADTDSAS